MDYMNELEGVHEHVLKSKKSSGSAVQIWELTLAMEYLITTLMEKERITPNIDEMQKRIKDIESMGLSIGDPKHGNFVLYAKVYDRLTEFIHKIVQHNIPFMVDSLDGDPYHRVWVKEEHAHQLHSVKSKGPYMMPVDD